MEDLEEVLRMSFEEMLEKAGERLQKVYEKALEMAVMNHREIAGNDRETRICVLSYMRNLIELMKIQAEVEGR